LKILPLDGGLHNRAAFDCGEPSLNTFLQQQAQQAARRYGSKTFVLVQEDDEQTILGYHTTLLAQVDPAIIPESRLGRGPIPMLLLARFAVDRRMQGKGFGKILLVDVWRRAQIIAANTALYGVVLDALNDEAEKFYEKHGFKALTDKPRHLYMPIGTIRELFGDLA
jgi:GNAT superfamily N-acetyltransferase